MRLSPKTDKGDCHIIDLVGSLSKMSGVVSIPSLLGLNPAEMDIEGFSSFFVHATPFFNFKLDKSLESLEARASDSTFPDTDVPTPTSITYMEEEDPFSVSSHGSSHVAALSRNSWVGCGDDIYVLECIGKGFIRIERSGGGKEHLCQSLRQIKCPCIKRAGPLYSTLRPANDRSSDSQFTPRIALHAQPPGFDGRDSK